MALAIATLPHTIAAVSVAGVSIRDVDQILQNVTVADCPLLQPEPLDFVRGFRAVRQSFGPNASAFKQVEYDLIYTYFHAPIGASYALELYDDLLTKLAAIEDAILTDDTINDVVDINPGEIPQVGPVKDPAGHNFLGAQLTFHVVEYVNA